MFFKCRRAKQHAEELRCAIYACPRSWGSRAASRWSSQSDRAELEYGVERMLVIRQARVREAVSVYGWTDSASRSAGIGYDLVTPRELT
jgi:hypothetical protein